MSCGKAYLREPPREASVGSQSFKWQDEPPFAGLFCQVTLTGQSSWQAPAVNSPSLGSEYPLGLCSDVVCTEDFHPYKNIPRIPTEAISSSSASPSPHPSAQSCRERNIAILAQKGQGQGGRHRSLWLTPA